MIWKYIKAESFFKDYLPDVGSFKKKISQRNTNGNPVDFSPAEKKAINRALAKMIKENQL